MKTMILFLTTILFFTHTLLAVNPSTTKEKIYVPNNEVRTDLQRGITQQLAPATPGEATFEEAYSPIAVIMTGMDEITKLAPITPKEAVFGDEFPSDSIAIYRLSPSTPNEATFEDPMEK